MSTNTNTVTVTAEWSPHSAQRDIMDSDARFRIIACGRRFGKTTLAAREAVNYNDPDGALIWWVAPTYDEADRGFDAVRESLPDKVIADTHRTWPKRVTLVNSTQIEFRSTERQNSNRGEGIDLLILDEADAIRESAWTEDLRPSLSDTQGDMIAISTPMRRGWFYRWFQRGQSADYPNVESWRFPTSANPHIPDAEIEQARRDAPERSFRQEYQAEFIDESGGVFTQLDDRLFTADYDLESYDGTPPYAAGWDFARHQDYFVGTVIDSTGDIVAYHRSQGDSWPTIQRTIEQMADRYSGPVALDASRDNKVVADLEDALGHGRVTPVKFSPKRKRELIEDLIATVESGELSAPEIAQLRHELSVFEYDVTSAGTVRYDAPEGMHDDSVDALALATSVRDRTGGGDSRAVDMSGVF